MEVNELVAHIRRRREDDGYDLDAIQEMAAHPSGRVELYGIIQKANVDRTHAADALETLAAERDGANTRCQMLFSVKNEWADRTRVAESRLAELAPVVEAARVLTKSEGSNSWDAKEWAAWDAICEALSTLEAANV